MKTKLSILLLICTTLLINLNGFGQKGVSGLVPSYIPDSLIWQMGDKADAYVDGKTLYYIGGRTWDECRPLQIADSTGRWGDKLDTLIIDVDTMGIGIAGSTYIPYYENTYKYARWNNFKYVKVTSRVKKNWWGRNVYALVQVEEVMFEEGAFSGDNYTDQLLLTDCHSLKTLHIPNSLKLMGLNFLIACPKLQTIFINNTDPPKSVYGDESELNQFGGIPGIYNSSDGHEFGRGAVKVHVPIGSRNPYMISTLKDANGNFFWRDFDIIEDIRVESVDLNEDGIFSYSPKNATNFYTVRWVMDTNLVKINQTRVRWDSTVWSVKVKNPNTYYPFKTHLTAYHSHGLVTEHDFVYKGSQQFLDTEAKDARLNSITANIPFTFDRDIYEYNIEVDFYTQHIDISAELSNNLATLDGDTGTYDLELGNNKFILNVTAYDTTITKVYTLNITRLKDNDATLKSINIDGYELTPTFNSLTFKYYLTVPNEQNTITLKAEGNGYVSYISGTGKILLNVGLQQIPLTVHAMDGSKLIYRLNVTRAGITPEPTPAGLESPNNSVKVHMNSYNVIIESPYQETVNIYSITGQTVKVQQKQPGEFKIPLCNRGIYLIKGSTGWQRKVIFNPN